MIEVKLNKSNNNPFYGLKNCLNLFQHTDKNITEDMLDSCYEEVKEDKEQRKMFFSLLFSIGDITARHHNIFGKIKRDSGGNANREGFHTVFSWLFKKHREQFECFLNAGVFNEYVGFDLLFRSRIKTKGVKVQAIYDSFADPEYRELLLKHIYAIVNGTNPFNKHLVAKFLTLPRLSKRTNHKKMLPETKQIMEHKVAFLIELSKLIGWEYEVKGTYCNFKGYKAWRKEYNSNLESVLFSTGKITEFSKEEFIDWLDKLPAKARFRVKNKVLYSKCKSTEEETPKYPHLAEWYIDWEEYKKEKQGEQRILEEKVRQGQANNDDLEKLEKIKKQAKVTVGATNFTEIYESITKGTEDKLTIESFVQNKVNLPYNSLVLIDDSGSMSGAPFRFASFIAAVCLYKNPDDDARNLIGFFDTNSHWHSYIDKEAAITQNSIMRTSVSKTERKPFVDPSKSFYDNYSRISSFCKAVFRSGGTNISSIPEGLHKTCQENPEVLDALKAYPIWTVISDGEWNNLLSPEASINDFMRKCENYFSFKPFIVAIDITKGWGWKESKIERFHGIDNFMYIPANVSQIEQFLTNFRDMDVFDIYTPLQSIYRSNRYDIIRDIVL